MMHQRCLTFVKLSMIGVSLMTLITCGKAKSPDSPRHESTLVKIHSGLKWNANQRSQVNAVLATYKKKAQYIDARSAYYLRSLYIEISKDQPNTDLIADLNRYITDEQYLLKSLECQELLKLKKICDAPQHQQFLLILKNQD